MVRLTPIAAQNAQNSVCAAVRDSLFTPKLSTSTKASGANIDTMPSMVGRIATVPDGSITVWWNSAESWLWEMP